MNRLAARCAAELEIPTENITFTPKQDGPRQTEARGFADAARVVDRDDQGVWTAEMEIKVDPLADDVHIYTTTIVRNQPDCGQQCTTFEVKCPQTGDGEDSYECTHTYKKWFCPLLFVIMTVGLGIAFALLVLLSCSVLVAACSACSSSLPTIATWFLLVGLIALGLFIGFPNCQKCVCGWMEKFFWRLLFGVGLVVTEFGGCCPTGLTGGPIMIGLGLLALYLWIHKCKPTVCDVVKDAILVIAAIVIPVTCSFWPAAASRACMHSSPLAVRHSRSPI